MISRVFNSSKGFLPTSRPSLLRNVYYRSSNFDPKVLQKATKLEENQPYFDRLIDFDVDYLAHIPYWLQPMEPIVDMASATIIKANELIGLPWWAVIMGSCVFIRLTMIPLIVMQVRRISQLAPIAPVLVHIKNIYKQSSFPKSRKIFLSLTAGFQIIKSQNLKVYRLFVYNLAHFPLIVLMIYTVRRLLTQEAIATSTFLHLQSLGAIDPYFILPFSTILLYYYNFERYITKANQHTLVSRIRTYCQYLLIMFLPFLCYWPSGIVLYMFTNALITVIQSTILMRPSMMAKVAPKTLFYNYLLGIVEYDKSKSEAVINTIKTGEEDFTNRGIQENLLVQQTQDMITNLNKELETKQENEDTQEDDKKEKKKPKQIDQKKEHK